LAPSPSPDRIGRLDFKVRTANLDQAMALRPRLEDIAWRLAPRAVEAVVGRLDLGDLHLRLDRLDLELGVVRPDHLEEDVLAALTSALAEALGEAVHKARQAPDAEARLISPAAAQLEHLERYLVQGVAPWTGRNQAFDPAEAVIALADADSQALVGMLRRHAHRRQVIERLVLQLGEEALQRLLRTLAPADAAVILALLADMILTHRLPEVQAVARIAEPALRRLFWVVVLEFLLRDPGTQFNRRIFLARLLGREARETGVSYEALVRLLEESVRTAQGHTGFHSSLPVVLAELLAEIRPADEIERVRQRQGPPDEEPFALALAGDFEPLLALLRRRISDDAALERLVRRLTPELFEGAIERIEPANADRIISVLQGLTAVQEAEPISPLPADRFETMLRVVTLRYFLRDAGTGYNRRRFLAYLLHNEAARARIDYPELVRLLAEALDEVSHRITLAASLPADLAELVAELEPMAEPEVHRTAQDKPDETSLLLATLRPHLDDESKLSALLAALPASRFEALIRRVAGASAAAVLEAMKALRAFAPAALTGESSAAREGRIRGLVFRVALERPGAAFSPSDWLEDLLEALAQSSGKSMQALLEAGAGLADIAEFPGVLADLLERRGLHSAEASTKRRRAAVGNLDGAQGAAVAQDLEAFAALYAGAGLPAIGAGRMETLLWSLAAAYLADHKGARFERRAFARHLLEGVARELDLQPAKLAEALLLSAEADGGPPPSTELLAALEAASAALGGEDDPRARLVQFLSTGRPERAGEALPALAGGDRNWLVSTIRRLVREDEAAAPQLLARLLTWLEPEEVLELLAPPGAARALIGVDALAAGELEAWLPLFQILARDEGRALPSVPAGADDPTVRLALIAHWLDLDETPAWAPGPATPAWLVQAASALPAEEIERLFPSAEPKIAARRRKRLAALLPTALVKRLEAGAAGDPARAEDARRDRLLAWLDGAHAPAAEAEALARHFAELAATGDSILRAFLRERITDFGARSRWARILPSEAFDRLVGQILPGHARPVLQSMRLLESAWRRTAAFGGARVDPLRLRALLLEALARPGPGRLVDIVQALASGVALASGDSQALRREVLTLARQGGQLAASGALARALPAEAARPAPPDRPAPPRPRPEAAADEDDDEDEDEDELSAEPDHALYVANAGLVLLNPYLPMLFERLGVLSTDEDGKPRIRGLEAASKAVHLLQYMADGRFDAPEAELALNKVLCGLPTAQPIEPSITPRPEDIEVCDGLLKAVIANWPIIKNTSIAGLRETFLQRDGRLVHDGDRWELLVQRKSLDVLVDQVPWSFSVIYHRWMPEALHVTW
jgi:hypothetical protein